MVEPEVVATSPCPIKSRVPVYRGFSSMKMARKSRSSASEGWCSRQDLHLVLAHGHLRDALNVVSLGDRPPGLGLRERLAPGQSGAGHDWILQPVLPRQDRFTKANRRLLRGGKS
jgi:hypothetical protein